MNEHALAAKLKERFERRPYTRVLKWPGGRFAVPGVSDFIIVQRERVVFLELKSPELTTAAAVTKAVSKAQDHFLREVAALGHMAAVTNSIGLAVRFVDGWFPKGGVHSDGRSFLIVYSGP